MALGAAVSIGATVLGVTTVTGVAVSTAALVAVDSGGRIAAGTCGRLEAYVRIPPMPRTMDIPAPRSISRLDDGGRSGTAGGEVSAETAGDAGAVAENAVREDASRGGRTTVEFDGAADESDIRWLSSATPSARPSAAIACPAVGYRSCGSRSQQRANQASKPGPRP